MVKHVVKKLSTDAKPLRNVTLLSEGHVLSEVTEFIPTGLPALDVAFGGGWPVGRISELFGPEATGKSALTHLAIQQCLLGGGIVILIDFEQSFDQRVRVQLLIDGELVIYCIPDYVEQAWNIIWRAAEKIKQAKPMPGPNLIVWDSLGQSGTKEEIMDDDAENEKVASLAKAMRGGINKLVKTAAELRAHVLFVNQVREKFGGRSFIKSYQTPGGKKVKHAATLRVACSSAPGQRPKRGLNVSGLPLRARVIKNKVAAPGQWADWMIDYERGPSAEASAFRSLLQARRIKSTGGGKYVCDMFGKITFGNPLTTTDTAWYDILEDPDLHEEVMVAYAGCVNLSVGK